MPKKFRPAGDYGRLKDSTLKFNTTADGSPPQNTPLCSCCTTKALKASDDPQ